MNQAMPGEGVIRTPDQRLRAFVSSTLEIIAYASRSETLTPGELIGTGTVGSGSGLELYKRLSPGDTVELEVAGVGTLANRIGEPTKARWEPAPRTPSPA